MIHEVNCHLRLVRSCIRFTVSILDWEAAEDVFHCYARTRGLAPVSERSLRSLISILISICLKMNDRVRGYNFLFSE